MQLTYPGTRISTLQEVFDFVSCADPRHEVLWNIESKIDAQHPNRTRGVMDFVEKQHAVFRNSPYMGSITVSIPVARSLLRVDASWEMGLTVFMVLCLG